MSMDTRPLSRCFAATRLFLAVLTASARRSAPLRPPVRVFPSLPGRAALEMKRGHNLVAHADVERVARDHRAVVPRPGYWTQGARTGRLAAGAYFLSDSGRSLEAEAPGFADVGRWPAVSRQVYVDGCAAAKSLTAALLLLLPLLLLLLAGVALLVARRRLPARFPARGLVSAAEAGTTGKAPTAAAALRLPPQPLLAAKPAVYLPRVPAVPAPTAAPLSADALRAVAAVGEPVCLAGHFARVSSSDIFSRRHLGSRCHRVPGASSGRAKGNEAAAENDSICAWFSTESTHADAIRYIFRRHLPHADIPLAALMDMGVAKMDMADLEGAQRLFEQASRMDPRYSEAWKKLAAISFLNGDHGKALTHMRTAVTLEPLHLGALSAMCVVLIKMKCYKEAMDATVATLELYPSTISTQIGYSFTRILSDIADVFQSKTGPFVAASLTAILVSCSLGAPKYATDSITGGLDSLTVEATSILPDIVSEDGRTTQVRIKSSSRLTQTGAPLQRLLQEVNGLSSNEARDRLCELLLDELDVSEVPERTRALKHLVWKVWFYHENPIIAELIQDGSGFMSRGNYAEAEWRFRNAVDYDSQYAEAWNRLAILHYLTGDYGQSLSDIDQTLDLQPRHFGALGGKSLIFKDLREFEQGAEALRDLSDQFRFDTRVAADAAAMEAQVAREDYELPAAVNDAQIGERLDAADTAINMALRNRALESRAVELHDEQAVLLDRAGLASRDSTVNT